MKCNINQVLTVIYDVIPELELFIPLLPPSGCIVISRVSWLVSLLVGWLVGSLTSSHSPGWAVARYRRGRRVGTYNVKGQQLFAW